MIKLLTAFVSLVWLLIFSFSVFAQSGATRPRRVVPTPPPTPTPTAPRGSGDGVSSTPPTTSSSPRQSTAPAKSTAAAAAATTDTMRAYSLLQQKLYDAALKEARRITASDPKNAEAWKIAGFAQVNLKRYAEAAEDLQRALELQRAAGEEDAPTIDALAQSYVRSEKFDRALPHLVTVTTRKGAPPDPLMLYYRGLAEYRTGKMADAERSFNAAIKADPKNSASLFYLGRLAFERKDYDAAISVLNRATVSDPRLAEAWTLLTYAYLRRAEGTAVEAKAAVDYESAVRASEGLLRVRPDEPATALHAQALIRANQYARAAAALERIAAAQNTKGETLYLLGFAHSRAKNFPKAIAALERAAAAAPTDVNIYRELGYAYEASRQFAKALASYEKGLQLAPDDADFKASAERIRPFAK